MHMRFVLQLLTLLALLVAPLAAPAAALASAQPSASACSQMQSGAIDHKMPASHHAAGEPCCVAIPPAIDAPATGVIAVDATEHMPFVALAEYFLLGAGPQFEDPPPRIA